MLADDDYYYDVAGRIPKFDNDGNPVTNETLGSGGSRREDGTYSAMAEDLHIVRDEDEDEETTSWSDGPDAEAEGESSDGELIQLLVAAVGIYVAGWLSAKAAPVIKRKFSEDVKPRLDGLVGKARRRLGLSQPDGEAGRGGEAGEAGEAPNIRIPADADSPDEVFSAEEIAQLVDSADENVMSSEEAKRRFLTMTIAVAVAVDQARALEGVTISDQVDLEELRKATAALARDETAQRLNQILGSDPNLVGPVANAILWGLLGGGVADGGEVVPITAEHLKNALALPEGLA